MINSPSYDRQQSTVAFVLESEEVFTTVVHTYTPILTITAYNITKNRPAAEDIVQEAFLKLWQKRTEIIPDNLGGWLYKVVCNLSYKHQKKESRQLHIVNTLSIAGKHFCTGVEEPLMNKENDRIFHNILNQLPEKQREVYQLSREKGLGRNEIAHQLNVSPNTVKVHLSRAMQYVREHIVSISLFTFFFIFNIIFFKKSNTIPVPWDLYKIKHSVEKNAPEKQIEAVSKVT